MWLRWRLITTSLVKRSLWDWWRSREDHYVYCRRQLTASILATTSLRQSLVSWHWLSTVLSAVDFDSQKQRKKMLFNVIHVFMRGDGWGDIDVINVIILTFMSLWEGTAEVISMSLEIKAVCSLGALHRQTDVFRLVYWGTSFTVVYHNCGAANYYVIGIIMTPLHLNEIELCETANFMSLLDGWL